MPVKQGREGVRQEMHKFKEGTLHSGSKGPLVKNRKQAIAIALSEAGMSRKKRKRGGVVENEAAETEPDDEAQEVKHGGKIARRRLDRKQAGGRLRSERTEAEKARRALRRTPPVTIMEDLVGRYSPSKGSDNAMREAIRERAAGDIKASGYEQDPWGELKPYRRGGRKK